MERNRDEKPASQEGEQNPTLNSPGSTVADYGNTTGGSGNDAPEQVESHQERRQENADHLEEDSASNP